MSLVPLPVGQDWKDWGRQVGRYLTRIADTLRWKTDEDNPSQNGAILWDEVNERAVISINGEWIPLAYESDMGKLSAFGDGISVPLKKQVSISGVYGALSNTETYTGSSGTVTNSGSEFVLQTGTTANAYANLWSHRPVVYSPGAGAECRITSRFTTGVASSLQLCGMFTAINGMFAGYNGTSFGFMHRYDGEFEIRTLTITAASNASATATVTLNGTGYTASVTNASAEVNAEEIASGLRAGAANLSWRIQAVGDTVVFQFRGSGAKSGSYSLSVSSGSLAGTFAQDNAGVTQTEDWTAQASWSEDTCSWLDPTKGNIYKFEYAYLGYGPLKFSVFNPTTRDFVLAHVIDWTNDNTSPNFNSPSLRPGWAVASLGSTTNLTVGGASAMGALQGEAGAGRPFGHNGTQASVSTETLVLALEARHAFNGRVMNGVADIRKLAIGTDSTKGAVFRVYMNPTSIGGTQQWNYEDEGESIMLYDTSGTTVTGGQLIEVFSLGPSGSEIISFDDDAIEMVAGDVIVVTAERTSGANAEMTASLSWVERV